MAQNALLKALEDDARAQALNIIKEAEDAAAVVVAQAEKEAGEALQARLTAMSGEFERRKAAEINFAKTRTQTALLSVRCALIAGAFSKAAEAVRKLPGYEYAELLNRLLAEAMEVWAAHGNASRPVVLAAPEDAGLIAGAGAEIKPNGRVSLGVMLQSNDGRVEYENTVGSRLNLVRPEMMPILDRILFDKTKT